MKIAIIDSGIHPGHPHVGNIAGGVGFTARGESSDYLDRLGHGTAVAGAVREKAPDAELYAVKVFDRALSASIETTIRAIEWSIWQRVDIINLSLGTTNPAHRPRFEAVLTGDTVIVSAFEHNDVPLLPGSMPGVFGVALDWDCPRDAYRVEMRHNRPVFLCSGFPRPVPGVPHERNLNGISFAVANMTGFVAQALAACGSPGSLPALLIERSAQGRVA